MNLLKDDSGTSAAEYTLIVALVGVGIIWGSLFLGNVIAQAMHEIGNCISTAGGDC